MLRYAVVACLLLLCAPLRAAAAIPAITLQPTETGINAALLTSNPAMTVRVDGYSTLTVYMSLVRGSATALTMTCTGGPTIPLQAPIGVASVATSGVITMASGGSSWTYPVSASGLTRIVVAPVLDTYVVCAFGGTGAGGSDRISVYARLSAP